MFQLLMLRAGLFVGIAVLPRSTTDARERHSIWSSYMTATVRQVNTCPAWTGDRLHTRGHRDICWLRQDAAQSGNKELRFDRGSHSP